MKDLIEEAREWWKLVSVKIAALFATLSAVFTANPELLVGLIGVIPVDPLLRLVFAGAVGVTVFLIPVLARMWPQNLGGDDDEGL
tara:strand:+ start:67 stop:321 length:255 start_codon:yes stop_codon:yes gene_type:complete